MSFSGGEINIYPKWGTKIYLAWIQNNVWRAPDLYWHDRACCNYHLRAFNLVFTEPLQWKAGADPKNKTVGAILLLDSISVSLWLLDNSIFGQAGGKTCDVNSPWNFTMSDLSPCHTPSIIISSLTARHIVSFVYSSHCNAVWNAAIAGLNATPGRMGVVVFPFQSKSKHKADKKSKNSRH